VQKAGYLVLCNIISCQHKILELVIFMNCKARWWKYKHQWKVALSYMHYKKFSVGYLYTGILFFLTARDTFHSDPLKWRLEFGQWPLLLFAVSRGPLVMVQSTAVNIKVFAHHI